MMREPTLIHNQVHMSKGSLKKTANSEALKTTRVDEPETLKFPNRDPDRGLLNSEQLEAALYLTARNLAFVWLGENQIEIQNGEVHNLSYCTYQVSPKLDDRIYFIADEIEVIPWDKIVLIAQEIKQLPTEEDQRMYLVTWSLAHHGVEPKIPQVKKKVAEFQNRHTELVQGRNSDAFIKNGFESALSELYAFYSANHSEERAERLLEMVLAYTNRKHDE